jgi:hypothetical protein
MELANNYYCENMQPQLSLHDLKIGKHLVLTVKFEIAALTLLI